MSLTSLKELLILTTLQAHPMHGYALASTLDQGLGFTLGLTRSTVYATLRRLQDRGLVSVSTAREGNYPDRDVCSVTPEGAAAAGTLLGSMGDGSLTGTYPVAAVLFLLDGLPGGTRSAVLGRLLEDVSSRLDTLSGFPEHSGSAGAALDLLRGQLALQQSVLARQLDEITTR